MQPNAFEALGLPVRYDINQSDIEHAYQARIVSAHPDLAGDGIQTDPSLLNEARRSLHDDETRARCVLAIRAPGVQAPPLTPEFLGEILDVRERAQEAVDRGDASAIEHWRQWADRQRRELSANFSDLVGNGTDTLPQDIARQAAGVLQRWRYIERMLEQVGVAPPAPDA